MWCFASQGITTNRSVQFSAKLTMELVPEELTAMFAMLFGAFSLSCDVNSLVNHSDSN